MSENLSALKEIFHRSKEALVEFMRILEPTIEHAKDEHEKLYFHHLYEEEEHRFHRIEDVLPKLDAFIEHPTNQNPGNPVFISLLQDMFGKIWPSQLFRTSGFDFVSF